ncbi:YegP family protein [Pseudarthrobacter sp. S9]|uniref:YegP family protein n=1 Tax=Pseudarthrobacter sp. S9 TaxID=3418421 RepID=UPI003D0535F9
MAAKYEVYKDRSGGFRFRLKASKGEVIASSESYKTKASAMSGVESVKKNAASPVVDLTEAATAEKA